MELNFSEQVKIILSRRGLSMAWLAESLGISPQNLYQQINRANFREADMKKICDLIDCDLRIEITDRSTKP